MTADALLQIEWDFDGVPDGELVACCYWEYARESAFIRDTLSDYRDWFIAGGKWGDTRLKLDRDMERIQSIGHPSEVFLRGCAFEPGRVCQSIDPELPNYRHPDAPVLTGSFPAPWQSLSKDERRERSRIRTDVEHLQIAPVKLAHWSWAKEIARECQHVAHAQHEQRASWERKYRRRDKKGNFVTRPGAPQPPLGGQIRPRTRWGVAETLMVDIAWDYFTNDEIANYFRKWVKVARPKEMPIPDDKGRNKRRDWRANLTRVAVMRLLARFTPLEIVDPRQDKLPVVWDTKQFSRPKWHDVTKWHDARREAGKLFHRLFPFLPPEQKPLSWERPKPAK